MLFTFLSLSLSLSISLQPDDYDTILPYYTIPYYLCKADYETTHNHGRGGMLYNFRNYMLSNINMPMYYTHQPPFRIVFSEMSSSVPTRMIDFTSQIDLLKKSFNPKFVTVESYVFKVRREPGRVHTHCIQNHAYDL